jgi:hypothetical protein
MRTHTETVRPPASVPTIGKIIVHCILVVTGLLTTLGALFGLLIACVELARAGISAGALVIGIALGGVYGLCAGFMLGVCQGIVLAIQTRPANRTRLARFNQRKFYGTVSVVLSIIPAILLGYMASSFPPGVAIAVVAICLAVTWWDSGVLYKWYEIRTRDRPLVQNQQTAE